MRRDIDVTEMTTESGRLWEGLRPLGSLQNSTMFMLSMMAKGFPFVNVNIFIVTSQRTVINLRIEYILPSFRYPVHSQKWRQSSPQHHLTKRMVGEKIPIFYLYNSYSNLRKFFVLIIFPFSDKETRTYLERLKPGQGHDIILSSPDFINYRSTILLCCLSLNQKKRYFLLRDYFVPSKMLNAICMYVLCMYACVLSCFSRIQLFVTLWTVAHQAPLSKVFSK